MATLNFNTGKNYIVPSENDTTYRGLAGDDVYIISQATEDNAVIKIIDTEGSNVIQLVDGITISTSLFTKNAARLTLSNGAEITINGADKFTFETSGNATSGDIGANRDYSDFVKGMGIVDGPPSSGSENGTSSLTVLDSFGWVDSKYFGSNGKDDITLTKGTSNDVDTGKGDDIIRNAEATDNVNAGPGADTVYISYVTLDPSTITTTIDGGSETTDFDWIICDLSANSQKDFTICRTAFKNFEGYDFTDSEKQTITLDEDDFVTINGQTLKISGDSVDTIVLPAGATLSKTEDSYNYYSLNGVEIAISDNISMNDSSSNYTIININASSDTTLTGTSEAEDFRYEIDNAGVSKEGAFTVTINDFDNANYKLTLIIVGGSSNLTTQEFDSLTNVEVTSDGISGTQIFFAPDSNAESGKLVLPNVEESFSDTWVANSYTVEIIADVNLV